MITISNLFESRNKATRGRSILHSDPDGLFFTLDYKKDLLVFSVNTPLNKLVIGKEYNAERNGGIHKHEYDWYKNPEGSKEYKYEASGNFEDPIDLTFRLKGVLGTFRVYKSKRFFSSPLKFELVKKL